MGIAYTRGFSTTDLTMKFRSYRSQITDKVDRVSRESAEAVKDLSVKYSPIDEGHLEEAHVVIQRQTRRGNAIFDVTFVDDETALYAEWIHEAVYNLGELSEAKAAATGQPVGRKFLERAYLHLRPQIIEDYRKVIREVIQ